jgi:hypothetical protein
MGLACNAHGEMNAYIFWSESIKGRDDSKYLGVDGRIILKWILRNLGGRTWIRSIWLGGGFL